MRKLKKQFHLVWLHFNNWECTRKALPLPANNYEVLFVNDGSPDNTSQVARDIVARGAGIVFVIAARRLRRPQQLHLFEHPGRL